MGARTACAGTRYAFAAVFSGTVRAHPRRLSALSVSHSKSALYDAFVWARRCLTAQSGGFRPGQECVTDFAAQENYLQSAVAQGSGSPEQLAALAALRKQTK